MIFDLKLSKLGFVIQAGHKAFNESEFKPIITNTNETMKKETRFEVLLLTSKIVNFMYLKMEIIKSSVV